MKQHLIIDNGAYSIKAGYSNRSAPLKVQNSITKTRDGLLHIGNSYLSHTNNYVGLIQKRPHDQGHLTSWETEKPVWDYTFDQLSQDEIDFSKTKLTLTESPFQLPQLSMNTDQIVFEEYGFDEYYRCIPASLVPWSLDMDKVNGDFTLVIDSGFSATWIVPVIYQSVYWQGVRKLPIGGKLLNGLLREIISFRHYDISDDPILVNTIKESTFFLATDFNQTLKNKQKYSCDFILPDFKTTTTGYMRTKEMTLPPDTQVLKLTDERFSIPESYFHPEIVFDNTPLVQSSPFKNITDLIVESIMACPEITRPLLSANIVLVGGSTNIPNFKTRLESELRRELFQDWQVRVSESDIPEEASWRGGVELAGEADVWKEIAVKKKEYFEHGANWCQKRFGFES
ncbi:actin-related protein [Spathaspora passalidarum NRRL Y-27907]|uniref:Actin-like protein ARP6 n=1 Tax=Spathaspora passalidarum (strain NRRL Y-27907 / 11-Y1) TaxID=619300 RepID=G3ATI0_SPAPN|nr:actin-related protein [Spathaspora passalidarum NRRL Y-27907]EGW30942.1 actin-related protein [Spathaspora passalidarum NRRL Y-27907]